MQLSRTARRAIAATALAMPFAAAVPALAYATTPSHDGGKDEGHHGGGHGDDCDGGGASAFQGFGLLGLIAQVNPATNVGGILNFDDVNQGNEQNQTANSGIAQTGCLGGSEAFQAGDLVAGALQVNPATNIGGILNFDDVNQGNEQNQSLNSGIQQTGGNGHNGGGHNGGGRHASGLEAVQGGDLIGITGQISPATNIGGIGSFDEVNQGNEQNQTANSGIAQTGGNGGGRHSAENRAAQGGSLLGIDLQISPATNIGGILNFDDVNQGNEQNQTANSGITQR